jgi:hypothetical protein
MTSKRWIALIALLLVALGGSLLRSVNAAEKYPTAQAPHPRQVSGAREIFALSTLRASPPVAARSFGQSAVLMTEGFEGGWPAAGWVISDTTSLDGGEYLFGQRNCHPHTGSYGGWSVGGGAQGSLLNCVDDYPDNARTWAIYGPIDLTEAISASVTFHLWGQSEAGTSCPYDYLYAGSSIDGDIFSGSRYCGDWSGGEAGNGYYQSTVDLSSRLSETQVWIGFEFKSDTSTTYGGFTLDDLTLIVETTPITLTPTPTSTLTPTPTPTPTATPPATPFWEVYLPLTMKSDFSGPTPTPTITPTPTATPTATPTSTVTPLPTIFITTGDVQVDQGNPTINYGSIYMMKVGSFNGAANRDLIKFDLAAIPAGTNISQATLDIYYAICNGSGTNTTVTTYRISESWDELTATWNVQPAYAEAYGSSPFTYCNTGWKSLDVTALVRAWVNGAYPNNGVLLRAAEGGDIRWAGLCTREGAGELGCYNYLRPHLTLTYGTGLQAPSAPVWQSGLP